MLKNTGHKKNIKKDLSFSLQGSFCYFQLSCPFFTANILSWIVVD